MQAVRKLITWFLSLFRRPKRSLELRMYRNRPPVVVEVATTTEPEPPPPPANRQQRRAQARREWRQFYTKQAAPMWPRAKRRRKWLAEATWGTPPAPLKVIFERQLAKESKAA